jgi:hypothetical protein
MRQILILLTLFLSACVGTDGQDDNNFVPFVPDMEMGADADMPLAGDMDPADLPDVLPDQDTSPDMTDMPPADMPDMGDMPDDMTPGVCSPNLDGQITQAEVPTMTGAFATYRVATDATVSTAGEAAMGGQRLWDLTGRLAGDRRLLVEAQDPTGRWFSTDFPDASYVARLSETSDLLGIFKIGQDELLLLGVASPAQGFTSTRLKYNPPVVTLKYPLTKGATWSTEAVVSGSAQGFPVAYRETYSSQVDAEGRMKTPYAEFPVLRVRTDLTRVVGFSTTTVRTYIFAAECFGSVATITSQDNEDEVEFTSAKEVRRLAP